MTQQPLSAKIVLGRDNAFTLDIDLAIAPGTTTALLGPNGAGKSTTVDALAGIAPIDSGRIALGERVLDDPNSNVFVPIDQRRIGIVFQDYLLFDHLDVRSNVAFGPVARGQARSEALQSANHWLDAIDISDLADRSPSQLSGGEAQRVALARALAASPELLLLDEPLSALDVETRTRLRRTLLDHLEMYDGPRLLITHDPTDAFLLADQICILEGGRITQTGSPDELRRQPATPYAAALAGLNLLGGVNAGGVLTLDDHERTLATADTKTEGPVLVTIRPNAIALHTEQPEGSPRNTWQTRIDTLERLGDITRVTLGAPLPLSVDITPGAESALGLVAGVELWASIKATEIHVNASR